MVFHILRAFGGDLKVLKGAGECGYREAGFRLVSDPVAVIGEIA
jgi:hypothetical protein